MNSRKPCPRTRILLACCGLALLAWPLRNAGLRIYAQWRVSHSPRGMMAPLQPATPTAFHILNGAKSQIGTLYDASYQRISYPQGDVAASRGACTDVVIRALRASNVDLQARVHNDMTRAWNVYPHPRAWNLSAPNAHIDHRRVPNQMTYLRRHAQSLPLSTTGANLKTWQPGDIVYWNTGARGNLRLHTGIVSDARNARGEPFVIHNGSVCIEDDALTRWPIIGHFRFPSENAATQ